VALCLPGLQLKPGKRCAARQEESELALIRLKTQVALNVFSAPFLFGRGTEIPTQTFSFSVRMRPELDDRA
jgi:hypothetical protein